jgi:hypothetical protein
VEACAGRAVVEVRVKWKSMNRVSKSKGRSRGRTGNKSRSRSSGMTLIKNAMGLHTHTSYSTRGDSLLEALLRTFLDRLEKAAEVLLKQGLMERSYYSLFACTDSL